MEVMTYNEMRKLDGGLRAECAIASISWMAAEYGLVIGLASGGIGLGIAFIGMAAGLYGVMSSC